MTLDKRPISGIILHPELSTVGMAQQMHQREVEQHRQDEMRFYDGVVQELLKRGEYGVEQLCVLASRALEERRKLFPAPKRPRPKKAKPEISSEESTDGEA